MAWALVGQAPDSGRTLAHTITSPGTAADQILILQVSGRGGGTLNVPTGWTTLVDNSQESVILGRVATNDASDDITAHSFLDVETWVKMTAWSGGTLNLSVAAETARTTKSGVSIQSITPAHDDCLCLSVATKSKTATQNGVNATATPGGYTEQLDQANDGSVELSLMAYEILVGGSGVFNGGGDYTLSLADWSQLSNEVTIALQPAAVGGSGQIDSVTPAAPAESQTGVVIEADDGGTQQTVTYNGATLTVTNYVSGAPSQYTVNWPTLSVEGGAMRFNVGYNLVVGALPALAVQTSPLAGYQYVLLGTKDAGLTDGLVDDDTLGAGDTYIYGVESPVDGLWDFNLSSHYINNVPDGGTFTYRLYGVTEARWSNQVVETFSVGGSIELLVAAGLHGHAAENIDLIQKSAMSVAEALHAHTAEGVTLSSAGSLGVQEATHGHTAESVALTQGHVLAVAQALHSLTSDGVVFTQAHALAVQEALHGFASDNILLSFGLVLDLQDALHAFTSEAVSLTQAGTIVVQEAAHGHTADNVALGQGFTITVADGLHGHTADVATLSQSQVMAVSEALHALTSEVPSMTQKGSLVVSDALHAQLVDNVVFPGTVFQSDRVVVVQAGDRLMVVVPPDRIVNVRH